MKITDIEQKIKELKDMGCGKNGITKELELVLYETLYDIMAGDSSSLRYEGEDIPTLASGYIDNVLSDLFEPTLYDNDINEIRGALVRDEN